MGTVEIDLLKETSSLYPPKTEKKKKTTSFLQVVNIVKVEGIKQAVYNTQYY